MPLEVLERQITELASHLNAATCRWLELVAEYDAREGWAQWGCRSCAHWVAWRCSLTAGAAREHVRVARRLAELPLLRTAFAQGRLSYSKLRALTRVEQVEREAELLQLAECATAEQLERLVRGYRQVVAAQRGVNGEPPERWVRWDHADDGALLLRARLPAEEGELVIAAIEAERERLAADAAGVSAETHADDSRANGQTREGGPTDEVQDVSAETPEVVLVPAGEQRADALVAIADTALGGGASRRTGGDRHQVVVHVELPALAAPPATTDAAGAEGPGRASATRHPTLGGHAPCELASGIPLAPETARRLACDASLVTILERGGRALDVGRKTRSIPTSLRRALDARDRGCRFPGCGATRFVEAHHIQHWADGGATELGNLVQLCRHHHRLLHEGGYTVAPDAGELVFRRRDGRRIVPCPAAPRGRARRAHAVARRRAGRPIRPDACVPGWSGERLDLDYGVDALFVYAPLRVSAETPRGRPGPTTRQRAAT